MPLWLERLGDLLRLVGLNVRHFPPIHGPETVVSIGWVYWVPVIVGLRAWRRKAGGEGLAYFWPFLAFLVFALLYALPGLVPFRDLVRFTIPLMEHFRTASRTGLFLPLIAGALIALSWPEIQAAARRTWETRRRWAVVFLVFSALELSWVLLPANAQPPMGEDLVALIEDVRSRPGDTVLDFPFCAHGGNGSCSNVGCVGLPLSTAQLCLGSFHQKKVHGVYFSRLMKHQCSVYDGAPYTGWAEAWREQRCLTDAEWDGFCRYLDEQPQLSAVLFWPGIWRAAEDPACRAELEARLGPPVNEARLMSWPTRGGQGEHPMAVRQYGAKCR
jgi:hypothetical protein